ncbi:MAG: hypothetical protein NTV14_01545 [Coprothermobacterota bacterium]|nr:hypothetical protein [Coprothermobacterota bacterium]
MAMLGGILLADSKGKLTSGAAFLLAGPSKVSETLDVCGTGEITVLAGNPYLVARHADKQPDQLYSRGFELAQRGLDLLSVTGEADLTLRDFSDEYILWWPMGNGQALRITFTSTLMVDVPPVTLIVKKQSGEVIPPPPPPRYQHHPAFRYYRLSQLTDDLQDAMRNIYLAFELMLSDRYPKDGKEKEKDWLRRGLTELAKDPHFPAALSKPPNEFIDYFMDHIYKGVRLPLFHAKIGRNYYPPQSATNERIVLSSAFDGVARLVLRMFDSWYNVRRMGGALYPKWVYENMEKLFSGARMVASPHNVLDRTEKDLSSPRFKTAVAVETRVIPHRSANEGPLVIAEFDRTALADAGTVRLFELVNTEAPLIGNLLDVELETDGIDHMECHCRTRLVNTRQPRCLFKW